MSLGKFMQDYALRERTITEGEKRLRSIPNPKERSSLLRLQKLRKRALEALQRKWKTTHLRADNLQEKIKTVKNKLNLRIRESEEPLLDQNKHAKVPSEDGQGKASTKRKGRASRQKKR